MNSHGTMLTLISLVVFFTGATLARAELVTNFVRPSVANPAAGSPDNFHIAVHDPERATSMRLLVFLPGTGGAPVNQTTYLKNAASLGLHAIGLTYPNEVAVNLICRAEAPLDPDCAGVVRREVIDGVDRTSLIEVSPADSIEGRLLSLLTHLHGKFPAAGWAGYFTREAVPQIDWEKITIAGHSQGGGHAALIAKIHRVDRCLMFGAMDYWAAGDRPYNWVSSPSLTPPSSFYALVHERDQFVDFSLVQVYLDHLGLTRYGGFIRTEGLTDSDFSHRHILATNLEPKRGAEGSYQGTTISNADTPPEHGDRSPDHQSGLGLHVDA